MTALRAALLSFLALLPAAAGAHPLAPSLLELEEHADGLVSARFTAPRLATTPARAEPVLPARCRLLGEPAVRADAARVVSEALLACGPEGLAGAEIGSRGLAETRTDLIVRVVTRGGASHQAVLRAGRPSFALPARASAARVALDYGRMGAAHLAGGPDHLLFVAALFALVPGLRRVALALTAFTLGHSVTLAAVALGLASPPAALVELGIAASLVALGLELATGARGGPGARPCLLAGGFGLLHGMGFAGALREIGLPDGALALALASFNAGIELAQLALVAVLAGLAPLARALPGAARAAAAQAVGAAGAFLVLDRLASLLAP